MGLGGKQLEHPQRNIAISIAAVVIQQPYNALEQFNIGTVVLSRFLSLSKDRGSRSHCGSRKEPARPNLSPISRKVWPN